MQAKPMHPPRAIQHAGVLPLFARSRCGELMSRALAALGDDQRGAVLVEYPILIGAVALAGALGLVSVGLSMLESFTLVRALLLAPIP